MFAIEQFCRITNQFNTIQHNTIWNHHITECERVVCLYVCLRAIVPVCLCVCMWNWLWWVCVVESLSCTANSLIFSFEYFISKNSILCAIFDESRNFFHRFEKNLKKYEMIFLFCFHLNENHYWNRLVENSNCHEIWTKFISKKNFPLIFIVKFHWQNPFLAN